MYTSSHYDIVIFLFVPLTLFQPLCVLCRYLSYVMNVATPTKDCLELVHELLVPVIKARSEKSLTRQEVSLSVPISHPLSLQFS